MSISTGKMVCMSLRYALLGLLRDEPASGYGLTRRFAQGIGRHAWSAKHSQIYPELRKLTDDGLIEVVAEGTRGKRVYGLTEAGRTELRDWLMSEPGDSTVRNEFLLRLFLISGLSPDDATRMLERVEAHTEKLIAELTATYDHLTAADGEPRAGAYAAKYGVFTYGAVRDWAHWAKDEQHKRTTRG